MVIADMSDNRAPLRVRVKSNDKLPKRVKVNVVALIMNSNDTRRLETMGVFLY